MKQIFLLLLFTAALSSANFLSAQCDTPQNLIELDGQSIQWDAVADANGYVVRYRETGSFNWQAEEIGNVTSFDITFLENCVSYDFRVRALCADNLSAFTTVVVSSISCGVCYGEYCPFNVFNDGISFITSVRVEEFVQTSNNSGTGFQDFRGNPEIFFQPGAETEIEIKIDSSSFTTNTVSVFVDFNRDLEFSPDEEVLTESLDLTFSALATISVPTDIDFGISRMRVIVTGFGYDSNDPCEEVYGPFWGEVEEYCVVLGEVPSTCDFDFSLELSTVEQGSASFSWDELVAASAYNYRYKKTSEPEEEWSTFATIDESTEITMLDDCEEYEFEIRGVCPFDTSAFKNSIVFNSFCPTSTNQNELLISQIKSFPNPWVDRVTLSINSMVADDISISIFNNEGINIGSKTSQQIFEGSNEINIFDTQDFPAGIYFFEVTNSSNRKWYHKALKIQ